MSESDFEMTPPELREAAQKVAEDLLPVKSKIRYEKAYRAFKDWAERNGAVHITESVVLAYFGEIGINKKASTLWAIYSMLKTTLNIKDNIDISKIPKLQAYLKKKNVGYKAKKSSVFTKTDVELFLKNAPDDLLAQKVALVIGISGACRGDELHKMRTGDIEFSDQRVSIIIPDTKTHRPRSFVVTRPDWVNILRAFMALRNASNVNDERLFLQLRQGKVTKQAYGHNSISKFPQKIATYLGLNDPNTYTGHCFRRTAATLLANTGGDVLQLKRLGGWKSTAVAEGYVENSVDGQLQIADLLSTPAPQRKVAAPYCPPACSTSEVSCPPPVFCSSAAPYYCPPPPSSCPATVTSASTSTQEYTFRTDEFKDGLHFTFNTHDQSTVNIKFVSNVDPKKTNQ